MRESMYGLPQAGIIAKERFVKHLAEYGYVPTKHTPSLFTCATRPIALPLVVDSFAVK
jgi:hypothetical protein